MSKKLRGYSAETKVKVALEAIKGEKSLVEICAENKISKTSVIEWRDKLASEAKSIFIPVHEKEKKEKALIQEIELLHKIIGEMTVTTNFLKKKLL